MDVVYTRHAKYQIKERKVDRIWIEETIKWPDIMKHVGAKYYAAKKLNGKVLKVVYVKESYIKIITLFWIRK